MPTILEDSAIAVDPSVREFLDAPKQLFINGEFVDAADGGTFATYDPATAEEITQIARAQEEDIDRAVGAAKAALPAWSKVAPSQRARVLLKLADLIEENADKIAQTDSLDLGKPLMVARDYDIPFVADVFRYYAGWATKASGDTLDSGWPDVHVYTKKQPIGVVGAIIAWNFPLTLLSWKVAPALAAGCTIVLKPAEQTPLSALIFAELCAQAGVPEGVVNVCTGIGEEAGAALVAHPDVRKISFTGSLEVGRLIAQQGARDLKHVTLELGGKSPNIIFADADVELAATQAAQAIFFNSGQVCCAGSRLMVEKPVYDQVLQTVTEEAGKHKLGAGLDPSTTLGPLVSEEQMNRVRGYLRKGEEEGAQVVTGGNGSDLPGYFVEPTIMADVSDNLTVVKEEIFGPVLVAQPFEDVEELTSRANDTEYGLSAGVWTNDVRKAHRAAEALEAGTVWINCYNYFDAGVPWGGWKLSGYGKDLGREAFEKHLETKVVWTNLA
jgi:phenylacetaldehyde dehydrogenase